MQSVHPKPDSWTPGRERDFRARERTPPARTTQQTRWTNRRPEEQDNRSRPQEKRRPSPHFGQARSRESTPTPTRRQSYLDRGRSPGPDSAVTMRSRIIIPVLLRTMSQGAEVRQQPAEVAFYDSPGRKLHGRPNRLRSLREGRPVRILRAGARLRGETVREPSHPPPDGDPYRNGFNFRNSPPEVCLSGGDYASPRLIKSFGIPRILIVLSRKTVYASCVAEQLPLLSL